MEPTFEERETSGSIGPAGESECADERFIRGCPGALGPAAGILKVVPGVPDTRRMAQPAIVAMPQDKAKHNVPGDNHRGRFPNALQSRTNESSNIRTRATCFSLRSSLNNLFLRTALRCSFPLSSILDFGSTAFENASESAESCATVTMSFDTCGLHSGRSRLVWILVSEIGYNDAFPAVVLVERRGIGIGMDIAIVVCFGELGRERRAGNS